LFVKTVYNTVIAGSAETIQSLKYNDAGRSSWPGKSHKLIREWSVTTTCIIVF